MGTKIGTCNYVSLRHLKKAYGSEHKSALAEGRVIVGKPEVKAGEKLSIDIDGRYFIEVRVTIGVAPKMFQLQNVGAIPWRFTEGKQYKSNNFLGTPCIVSDEGERISLLYLRNHNFLVSEVQ